MKRFTSLLFLALTNFIFAQIVVPSAHNYQTLDSSQISRWNSIDTVKGASFFSYTVLEFNSLVSSNNQGKIDVVTGKDDCGGMQFTVTYLNYNDSNNYLLLAEIINDDTISDCASGSMVMIMDSGTRFGEISYNKLKCQIYDLGGGVALLAELDSNGIGCEVLGNEEQSSFGGTISTHTTSNHASSATECADDV